jgi:hypothetical protein
MKKGTLGFREAIKVLCLFVVALCGPNRHEYASHFKTFKKALSKRRKVRAPWLTLVPPNEPSNGEGKFFVTDLAKSVMGKIPKKEVPDVIFLHLLDEGDSIDEIITIGGVNFSIGEISNPEYVAKSIAATKEFKGEIFLHMKWIIYSSDMFEHDPALLSVVMDVDLPVIEATEIVDKRLKVPHRRVCQLYEMN